MDQNMIKTNIDKPAKPEISLIILGVLKGYFNNAEDLWKKTLASKKELTNKLLLESPQYPADFVNLISTVTALYGELKKELENYIALSIVKAAFLPAGLAMQIGNFRYIEDNHTFDNLIKYQQRTNKEGPTRFNKMEVIRQDDSTYEFHVHNCMFSDVFSKLGVPELTKVMCAIDNISFNVYLPDVVHFHRNGSSNTIIGGKDYCTFICENIHRE